jgi:hypothetical protein
MPPYQYNAGRYLTSTTSSISTPPSLTSPPFSVGARAKITTAPQERRKPQGESGKEEIRDSREDEEIRRKEPQAESERDKKEMIKIQERTRR